MQGTELSAYRILAELGSGGMGTVYRAEVLWQATGLSPGTVVALKVIHPHLLETPGFFKRFLREAQIGQQVRHENVVKTYDCDATRVGGASQHFLVMEYVEGQTLRELLEELERVPEELCRHVGREIAKGLAAIHDAGVLHRDIKPENVLITREHVVKVMDLGVARIQDEAMRLSQAGAFVGSLEYAAPEQFASGREQADGRADLHALGVVLYELATGHHPYRDEDAGKVMRRILDETPRRPGEVNPQLSPFFEEAIVRLLAKDRNQRFATAAELAQVLEEGERSAWWKEHARALRIETRQPLRRIRVPRETALYGREDELARLHELYARVKDGEGQVLIVEGEAGIGKTRLVDEFVGRLRQEGEALNFLFGSYPPGGAATVSGAFSTAYREHFGEASLEDTLAAYLGPTPILVPAFAALLRGETTPTGAQPLTKDSLQTVFVHATRALAKERSTIVLIDDLHFAPEDGRALFASLALAAPGHRILLVGTSRPGVAEGWIESLSRVGPFTRMNLARLGPKDLFRLLQDAFQSERLAEQLGMQVSLKSDGNPFFTFEIIRGLREGQFITQQPDGTWMSTRVIQDIRIPASVRDLIQARLRDLDEEERDLLEVASCCGFEFDPVLVASTLGLGQIPAMKRFARIEARHRLVRSAGAHYVFDHHQVQEGLYAGMHEKLREPYHLAIAKALEARGRAGADQPSRLDGALLVELCGHFLKGARGECALGYLDGALDHLEKGYLNDQAIRLAERVLEVPGLLQGTERAALLLRMNRPIDLVARRELQEHRLDEALALADETGDGGLHVRIHTARGALFASTSRYEPARVEFERALDLSRRSGDRIQEAAALKGLGYVLEALARYEEASSRLEESLSISRETGDSKREAQARGDLGNVFWSRGRSEEAIQQFDHGITLARGLGDRALEGPLRGSLGLAFYTQGRIQEGRAQMEQSLVIARETGNRVSEATASSNLALTFDAEGMSAEALARYEHARTMHREVGRREGEGISLHNEGTLLAALGAQEEAAARQQAALDIGREIGFSHLVAAALTKLAALREETVDCVGALALHREALERFAGISARDEHAAEAHLQYGACLARSGREAEAGAVFQKALEIATEAGAQGTRVLAMLQITNLGDGHPAEAIAAFTDARVRMNHDAKTRASFLLHKVTGGAQPLEAAHDLLTRWVEQAPERYRQTTLTQVRLHREIMQAWRKQQASV